MSKRLRVVGALLLLCCALLFALWKVSRSRTFQLFGEIIPRVETTRKVVALTFDDGPTPAATDTILSILERENIPATFFVTGRELEENMASGRKLVAAGHELGNHTYSHERMILVSPSFIEQEVDRTDSLIRVAGHTGDIHFRAPFCFKLIGLPRYLASIDKKMITWDIEPESYPEIGSDSRRITEHVLENVQPGSIILLHVMYPSRVESMKAVPELIARLKKEGYSFVTVSSLLAADK